MYWILQKAVQSMGVRYLRRALQHREQWVNNTIEVLDLPSGERDIVFNRFFFENEAYPCIIVSAGSADPMPLGLGDYINDVHPQQRQWSADPSSSIKLQTYTAGQADPPAYSVQTQFTPGELITIASIDAIFYRPAGSEPVKIYAEVFTESFPGLMRLPHLANATGTLWPRASAQEINFPLNSPLTLDPSRGYGVVFTIEDSTGPCYIFHSGATGSGGVGQYLITQPGNNSRQGIAVSGVRGKPQAVYGGYNTISLSVTAAAKDLATSRDLGDIIFLYLASLKRMNLRRDSDSDLNVELVQTSDFTRAGVFVAQTPRVDTSERKRAQENLFLTTVTVSLVCPWRIGLTQKLLRELDIEIEGY